ncbi:MAG: hypothetical protein ACXWAT_14030, partial [Methylobacter sp.]
MENLRFFPRSLVVLNRKEIRVPLKKSEDVMNRKFSKKLLGIITGIISLLLVSATPQAAPGNGGKPVDAGYTADLPAGFFNPTNCPFPIRVTVTGNAKSINLPGNGFIITAAPQQQAVITNLDDPTKTV